MPIGENLNMTSKIRFASLVALALTAATVASAQHYPSSSVTLETLTAHYSGSQIAVTYRLPDANWRWHRDRRTGATLVFQLRTPSGGAGQPMEVRVGRRDGQILLDTVPNQEIIGVDVWVLDGRRRDRFGTVNLSGVEVKQVLLPISGQYAPVVVQPQEPPPQEWHGGHPHGQPQYMNWAGTPQVIEGCGNAFDGQANETECMNIVSNSLFDPTQIILNCESAMDGDDNELRCVRTAVQAAVDPSRTLAACEMAMDGDDAELACLAATTSTRFDASGLIKACEDTMDGDSGELDCIRAASVARWDPTATIVACEKGMSGDDAELACIKRGITR